MASSSSKCLKNNKKCNYHLMVSLFCFQMLFLLINAKNLDLDSSSASVSGSSVHHHLHADSNKDTIREACNSVSGYFESIDVKIDGNYDLRGSICGGHCCSNATESELKLKSTTDFERLLHHHTKSLRGILETTSSSFRNHVLELTNQSENKTLYVFSQVYRRMLPLSRKLIQQLYSEITRYLNASSDVNQLETAVHTFFVDLFPVAYHQAVHLNKNNYGDLHEDYVSCLKHTFDDLQPFGKIPKDLNKNLLQSITTATVFINALEQSASVLASTDELDSMYLTQTCQKQLLKMSYCPSCIGLQKKQVKTCYSYCSNVMRGCLAQYVGVLDSPWSNVAEAIENLVTTYIQADSGIVNTIKMLDSKLSEAIMLAMENGPELERKVKKTCGTPKLLPTKEEPVAEIRAGQQNSIKWATPPDAELLKFLSTIEKSKEFYSRIVNNVCEDEDIQRSDRHCWTGDRIGDYTQVAMTSGVDAQKYNPEVPLVQHSYAQSTKLNELVDKLIKIRSSIGSATPSATRTYSDIQSDMARHDEEGSGRLPDDNDDEEDSLHGSGDGSGDGGSRSAMPEEPVSPRSEDVNEKTSSSTNLRIENLPIILVLVIFASSRCFSWR